MKAEYAINKLKKESYTVTEDNGRIEAKKEGQKKWIRLSRNGGDMSDEICIIDLRREEQDDVMTDYHAGTYCDSLKEALELATSTL